MKTGDLKIGMLGAQLPPVDRLIETSRRHEERGLDSLWWIDHLMGFYPESIWQPDITPMAKMQRSAHVQMDTIACLAAAAVVTNRMTLGVAVTDVLRRHPAMLAQEFLSLDHLSKGRVVLGLGSGESKNIVPYGIDFDHAVGKLEEAIRLIRLLWTHDEPLDFTGRFWQLKDAVVGLTPYREGCPPPIWLGALGPRMLRITGTLADGWVPVHPTVQDYGEKLAVIRQAAVEAGRDPQAITPAIFLRVLVDSDHDACHRMLDSVLLKTTMLVLPAEEFHRLGYEHPLGDDFYGLRDYIPTRWGREISLDAAQKVPRELVEAHVVHGTPEEVVEGIAAYVERGLKHLIMRNVTFLGDADKTGQSFRLLAEVVKYLRGEA